MRYTQPSGVKRVVRNEGHGCVPYDDGGSCTSPHPQAEEYRVVVEVYLTPAERDLWGAGKVRLALEGDPREVQREHYRRLFDLQRQAREAGGRHIISGGSGWRGSFYGAVVATYPEGSRTARQDSWRCHHEHPDDMAALECALGEVRRLAAGGSYEPCAGGPSCGEKECRRDWKRLEPARAVTGEDTR